MGAVAQKGDSVRTCIGCSEEEHPANMERFVFVEDFGLLHDVRRKAPGRGAHVHPSIDCIEGAVKRGFSRGFRRKVVAPPANELIASMADGIERRLTDRLRAAFRGGTVFVGGREADEGMKCDEIAFLLIARDAGDSTRKKYASNADRKAIPVDAETFDAAELGALVGRDRVAVFGMSDTHAEFVAQDLAKLRCLAPVEG